MVSQCSWHGSSLKVNCIFEVHGKNPSSSSISRAEGQAKQWWERQQRRIKARSWGPVVSLFSRLQGAEAQKRGWIFSPETAESKLSVVGKMYKVLTKQRATKARNCHPRWKSTQQGRPSLLSELSGDPEMSPTTGPNHAGLKEKTLGKEFEDLSSVLEMYQFFN